jgi:hypothetical protein
MKRSPLCYLCGLPGADTREHVIPYCFFTNPRPADLLTLPAHEKCNLKYSISDEYSRNILAWLGMDSSKTAQALWDGQISRAFKRSAQLRRRPSTRTLTGLRIYTASTIEGDRLSGESAACQTRWRREMDWNPGYHEWNVLTIAWVATSRPALGDPAALTTRLLRPPLP